jgi:hypothetical protein
MAKAPTPAAPAAPIADTPTDGAPVAPTTAPEAPAVPAADAKPVKVKIEREKQNGQTKPAEGTLTRKLWDIIDAISAKNAAPATRKEVMEAAAAAVPPFNTAMSASLYSHWRKFHGLTGTSAPGRTAKPEGETPAAPAAPEAPVAPVAGETPVVPEAPVAPVAPEAPAA